MKSIFQLIFLATFFLFGILNALQIHESVTSASVDNSLLGNEVFDMDSEVETKVDEKTNSQTDNKMTTEFDYDESKSSNSDMSKQTGTSKDTNTSSQTYNSSSESDIYENESTASTQDFETYQSMDKTTTGTTTSTDKSYDQTSNVDTTVQATTMPKQTSKVMRADQTNSYKTVTPMGTSDDLEIEDYTVGKNTYNKSDDGYQKDVTKYQSTSTTPTETSTTKHVTFDGEGFLKAVSKLVNIRKRVNTGNDSVATTKDYQKSVTRDTTDSTKKPTDNQGDHDNDDEDDQESFFDKYGIPEYVFWIIVYTVPVLFVLLLCLTSYCCCCRR
ncbi:signal peptide plus GPI anchored membrane protein [Cryptosporidium parvum Iowa II]|uniref:Signal peptide plus GPI anchored membrane protein n=2 Tax=Cryptosporidium parvum TaxID=5807 RepID=Q5CXU7_CRYPI|nr:signal peptide plus GPI anchored membrane protein [Cryptosporidium parvum Iowa II]EAK90438.1 signal peptide plus GPI anchored membrane protein [Cryptosporidium parvum Iowa II]QOY40814.1 Uncharacterized Protein CPATCC_0010780 [Cryptosporidium parvum]WKS79181.1 GPI anchored membrane protein [Cryptosporidium sp. 43IA8]WRK33671.1 Uncharacterized Protein cpbgf_7004890 [Cryptosporidium parvum]|eukprot:QOY40814.1 hypothetical protein CPATCC_003707 [Cryptosporidium parvum]